MGYCFGKLDMGENDENEFCDVGEKMTYQLLIGDCMETLKTLPDCSVQCVVTSPPYYGLRDYGTAKWEGGNIKCKHNPQKADGGARANRTLPLGRGGTYKDICKKCGAIRIDNQIGLEQSPEEYVAKLVDVFREVKRVLKDDGTFWLNLGDSYAGSGGAGGDYSEGGLKEGQPKWKSNLKIDRSKREASRWGGGNLPATGNLKPKDLIGIPWMVAFALRADGWWLRQDIIWAKTNPMPESVTDRCTKSHEYIFLLTKSAKYFYDAEAIKEPSVSYRPDKLKEKSNTKNIIGNISERGVTRTTEGLNLKSQSEKTYPTRNKRDVWIVPTKPFKGAHFAVFPPDLITPCILAGTSEKGECPKCGKAWVRVIKKDSEYTNDIGNLGDNGSKWVNEDNQSSGSRMQQNMNSMMQQGRDHDNPFPTKTTIGWQPQCECGLDPIPQLVLDPFSGSGTTLMVAIKHGRNAIGCELNLDYAKITEKRLEKITP